MAQGKQGIWMFVFQDGEKTAYLPKICFTQAIYLQMKVNFKDVKIKGCNRVVVGCSYNLLAVKTNFELRENPTVELS